MSHNGCDGYRAWEVNRRTVLKTAAIGAISWLAPSAISQMAVAQKPESCDMLVVVFLRGGMDGLNVVVPYLEDDYHRERPTLRLYGPKEGPNDLRVLELDGHFGLHPSLKPLHAMYQEGTLAIAHAVGSRDTSRSHFEAMMTMERGSESANAGIASGWIGRYLNATMGTSPLRAVSFSAILPDSLRGNASAHNLQSVLDFRFDGSKEMQAQLEQQYAGGKDEIASAGRETLRLLKVLNELDYAGYRPESTTAYPDSDLGNGLRQAAFLAKADLGVEVVALDTFGWDTHVTQGVTSGWMPGLLEHLATSLEAFVQDMKQEMKRVTVVVMTEFGRRIGENGGLGTDHGRASCLFALGGNVNGGKIFGDWPTLSPARREGGDLAVATDYRRILAEVLERRMGVSNTDPIFPGFAGSRLGMFRA
jgi:uncharacterized protein (DUF1501 family)